MFQPINNEKPRSIWMDLAVGVIPPAIAIILQKVVEDIADRIRHKRELTEISEEGVLRGPDGELYYLVPVEAVEEAEQKMLENKNKVIKKTKKVIKHGEEASSDSTK